MCTAYWMDVPLEGKPHARFAVAETFGSEFNDWSYEAAGRRPYGDYRQLRADLLSLRGAGGSPQPSWPLSAPPHLVSSPFRSIFTVASRHSLGGATRCQHPRRMPISRRRRRGPNHGVLRAAVQTRRLVAVLLLLLALALVLHPLLRSIIRHLSPLLSSLCLTPAAIRSARVPLPHRQRGLAPAEEIAPRSARLQAAREQNRLAGSAPAGSL